MEFRRLLPQATKHTFQKQIVFLSLPQAGELNDYVIASVAVCTCCRAFSGCSQSTTSGVLICALSNTPRTNRRVACRARLYLGLDIPQQLETPHDTLVLPGPHPLPTLLFVMSEIPSNSISASSFV